MNSLFGEWKEKKQQTLKTYAIFKQKRK